jgi:hypothetical protein
MWLIMLRSPVDQGSFLAGKSFLFWFASGGFKRILLQIILPGIQKFLREEVNLWPISWCWGRIGLEEGRAASTIDDGKSLSVRYHAHRGL